MSLFPFDVVFVTTPDETAAQAAREGPLPLIASWIKTTYDPQVRVPILSSCDPFESRCGSGGGTLAALDLGILAMEEEKEEEEKIVLIVHAGGDSSRCPTQMALGKSWTSLPQKNALTNPTTLLLHTLARVLEGIPKGSIVVAASDTLLRLDNNNSNSNSNNNNNNNNKKVFCDASWKDQNLVLGVGVPAPLTTAKNHGIFVIKNNKDRDGCIQPVHRFLQKPTVEEMRSIEGATFFNEGEESAWIDTGVVVFLPPAAKALHALRRGCLSCCTERGLRAQHNDSNHDDDIKEFARRHTHKVDLYTHILLALSTPCTMTMEEYVNAMADLPNDLLEQLYQTLSPFALHALVLPKGRFLHLGTSRELLDFYVRATNESDQMDLQLVKGYNTFLTGEGSVDPSCVVLNSWIESDALLRIGEGTVVEHSFLKTHGSVVIGKGCLVSGWRNRGDKDDNVCLPDQTLVQMLPLKTGGAYACIYMGVNDEIKKWNTLYGMDAKTLMERAQLSDQDIWQDGEKKMLWTARIHPILANNETSFSKLVSWLHHNDEASLQQWKNHPKMSLQEIRDEANALTEFQHRRCLETEWIPTARTNHLAKIERVLLERLPQECRLLMHDKEGLQQCLQHVFKKALQQDKPDVCGRAFMVLSAFLGQDDKDERVGAACTARLRATDSSPEERLSACEEMLRLAMTHHDAMIAERAAHAITEYCVCGGMREAKTTKPPAPLGVWVVATAPARVDLAGGWSDTPPISYEHGGAVCGLAVLVDGYKPLSCRCRTRKRRDDNDDCALWLRVESRDGKTGALQSCALQKITTVGDLGDYRDPLAECALLKCALVFMGLQTGADKDESIQPSLNRFLGRDDNVCLEVVCTSLLPRGSGLGTSSILGGCVLKAISECCGAVFDDDLSLMRGVLMLEQLLTTGGGWQDQVNGLMGGAKVARSSRNKGGLHLTVDTLPEKERVGPLLLVFTGKTRLAKNLLRNVLRRWARRTPEIVQNVTDLVENATQLACSFPHNLAQCLNAYRKHKNIMAGHTAEPPLVKKLLHTLIQETGLCTAGSLCGAGGGGFMVLLLKQDTTKKDVMEAIRAIDDNDDNAVTCHDCCVSQEGLCVTLQEHDHDMSYFDMSWHQSRS